MRPRIAVIADSPDENWPSMDLVAEMLVREWRGELASEVDAERLEWNLPNAARRLSTKPSALNVDRVLGRFVRYPAHAAMLRRRFDFFHVADHTYAQVVHALPHSRTGVYCHDMDAFRSLIEPEREKRSAAFRAMTRLILEGMRRARFVFHSTREMGRRLERVVPRERLVYAPYGLSEDFSVALDADDGVDSVLASLNGAPFLLHVSSAIPRKRLDVLFDAFARLRAKMPTLRLVQQGGVLTNEHREHLQKLEIEDALLQPPKLPRRTLAGLYRRAAVVLLPSEAEGFGLS
ncbi:MAG: glycosyltransferase, partial [Polyangiaceae bacterium]